MATFAACYIITALVKPTSVLILWTDVTMLVLADEIGEVGNLWLQFSAKPLSFKLDLLLNQIIEPNY